MRRIAALLLATSTVVGSLAVPTAASALAASSAYTLTQAEAYVTQSGTQTEPTTDTGGGFDVGYFTPGDWIAFDLDFGAASPDFVTTRIANGSVVGATCCP